MKEIQARRIFNAVDQFFEDYNASNWFGYNFHSQKRKELASSTINLDLLILVFQQLQHRKALFKVEKGSFILHAAYSKNLKPALRNMINGKRYTIIVQGN